MDVGGARLADLPVPEAERILTPEALRLVVELHRRFDSRRRDLLAQRPLRRAEVARAGRLSLDPATREIREDASWRVAAAPADLRDRRVEITGPTEAKMLINAWNSGARVHLADFEDATAPTWHNVVTGQANLVDANRRQLAFTAGDGRRYELAARTAVPVVRPRGWHLTEAHVEVDGEPVSASIFDFALYLHHNAEYLLAQGSGPYFYLPKLESHHEAELWNDIFVAAQEQVGVARGSIRATVLIETIMAASQMDEILFALREHAAGLNAGRWDYLFSLIKVFRDQGAGFVLPDRNSVTMTVPFMRRYTDLLVHTCHRRGALAIGGMAAFIPNRRDPQANAEALEKVRQDKLREAGDGFDGSWVAHPDLVPVAMRVFDDVLGDRPNQLDRLRPEVSADIAGLTAIAEAGGRVTEAGVRNNISVSLQYLAAWLGGSGAVAIFNLMEDVATAEIARSQLWQWLRNSVVLDTGATLTPELVRELVAAEYANCAELPGVDPQRLSRARAALEQFVLADSYADFLTLLALPGTAVTAGYRPGPGLAAVIAELTAELGAAAVLTDPSALRAYDCDGLTTHRSTPGVVLLAADAAAVARAVSACARHGVPFVARGAGTGLSGGATPRADGRAHRHQPAAPTSSTSTRRTGGRWSSRASSTWRSRPPPRRTACTTRPIRPASRRAPSAATSRRTPAARTASSTASP